MRVKGPPPSQRIHIAKAVQDGMRAMFRGVSLPTSIAGISESESSEDLHRSVHTATPGPDVLYETPSPAAVEERVKVGSRAFNSLSSQVAKYVLNKATSESG